MESVSASRDDLYLGLLEQAEKLHNWLKRKIPRRFAGAISPDDVLQEVWLAAFRNESRFGNVWFDQHRNELGRWLLRVTERKLIDAIRFERAKKRAALADARARRPQDTTSYFALLAAVQSSVRSPSSHVAAIEANHAVRIALCRLPDNQRRALSLCFMHGQPKDAIAKILGSTVPAVRGLVYRGLRNLRELLGASGFYFENGGVSAESATRAGIGTNRLRKVE